MSEFNVEVGIQLGDTTQLDNLKNELNNLSNKPVKINLDLGSAKNQIDALTKQLKNLNNIKVNLSGLTNIGNGMKGSMNGIQNIQRAVGELGSINLNNANSQISNLQRTLKSMKFDRSSIDTITQDLSKLDIAVEKVTTRMNGQNLDVTVKGVDQLGRTVEVVKQFDSATGQMNRVRETITSVSNAAKQAAEQMKQVGNIDMKFNAGGFDKELSNINSQFNKLQNASNKTKQNVQNLNKVYSELNAIRNSGIQGNEDKLIAKNKEYEQSLKRVQNQLKVNANEEKEVGSSLKFIQEKQSLNLKMEAWLRENSKAAKKFGSQIRSLQEELKTCDSIQLNGIKSQFTDIKSSAKAAGLAGLSFRDALKEEISTLTTYFSGSMLLMQGIQSIRNAYDNVKAIDTAMTELKKVTDETDNSYKRFMSDAANSAKEIGTSIDDYITSTADFARLGYNFQQSQELAKTASIYNVVGDDLNGIEDATQSVISTMKAFNVQANDSISVVDKFNEVSNNYAISSGGLGQAMQNAASSLATGGNDIDQSLAMITAANEIAQDPSKVGNGLRTNLNKIKLSLCTEMCIKEHI